MTALDFLVPVLSAAFAAGGAYMAVRVELRAVRRDVDRHETALADVHSRINRLIEHIGHR